jgi:hypothetical protein
MLSIITRHPSIFKLEHLKDCIKKLLKKTGGPAAVEQSLIRGLRALGIKFNINPPLKELGEIVHVIRGTEALRWVIKQKNKGRTLKLIAGPNLVVIPTEQESILANPAIDRIIVPSEWVKAFYKSLLQPVSEKIKVWPAGVSIPPESLTNKGEPRCLIFKKDVEEEIYNTVISELKKRKIQYSVVEYGKYKQANYFSELEHSKFMIYLQRVESQGLALQEAWARDVPSLVWNKGHFTYPTGERVDGNIAAPLLTPETGMFFKNAENFPSAFDEFQSKLHSFTPRDYVIKNLSDKVCAENYLKIINE